MTTAHQRWAYQAIAAFLPKFHASIYKEEKKEGKGVKQNKREGGIKKDGKGGEGEGKEVKLKERKKGWGGVEKEKKL